MEGIVLPRCIRGRFSIDASPGDRTLKLPNFLFRGIGRLGRLTPATISPVTRDDLATVGGVVFLTYDGNRTDPYGHSYFTSDPEVSADAIKLIRNGISPGTSGRRLKGVGKITWRFE